MSDLERGNETALAGGPGTGPAPSPALSQDLAWESDLVELVSALDSFRVRIQDECAAGRLLGAVETMLDLAKGLSGFVASRLGDAADHETRSALRASSEAFFVLIRPLHDRLDDDVFKALARLLRPRDRRDPWEQFAETGRALRTYLKGVFVLCAGRFLASSAAHAWTETYTVFLDELDGLIEQARP